MKIIAEKINCIKTRRSRGFDEFIIDIEATDFELDDMFSVVWEQLGDEWLRNRLRLEEFDVHKPTSETLSKDKPL